MRPTVEIKELRIRASGLTRAEARRLGEAVARELLESAATLNGPRNVRELAIRVSGVSKTIDRLAQRIGSQIRKSLK